MMVEHERVPLDAPERWREALRGLPHGLAHTWEYCQAVSLSSDVTTYLYRYDDGEARIVCPLAERSVDEFLDVTTPYGLAGFVGSGDSAEFATHWRAYAEDRGYVCGFFTLSPLWHTQSYFDAHDVGEYNAVFVLDLGRSQSELLAGVSRRRREQLRAWERLGGEIVADRDVLAAFVIRHHRAFMRERGASEVSLLSPPTLAALCALPNVLLLGAASGGRLEAAVAFGYTQYAAEYLLNVSVGDGARHTASLVWRATLALKNLGVPLASLGGGVRAGDSLAEFKRRFGARPVALRAVKHVYRPAAYAELCRRVGADPADRSGYFPAYRAPRPRPRVLSEAVG